MTKAGLDNGIN